MNANSMVKTIALTSVLTASLCAVSGMSYAESSAEAHAEVSYNASRNHAGLLNYCLGKGYIDANAAKASKARIASQVKSVPSNTKAGDLAEEKGKKGIWIFEDGSDDRDDRKLEDSATRMGTTPQGLCKTLSLADTIQ